MSDDEVETTCPLCVEEMDLCDQNFLPCPCGYRVCMWCWHHIRENLNGLCPACRTPYNSDPHAFSAVDREDVIKKNRERKQKEKQEKKVSDRVTTPGAKSSSSALLDRKHLHNYRVVQRNLVYVIGIPATYANEDNLRKPEMFGQYGKINKVVVHRNHTTQHATVSVYVTFAFKEDAKAAIQALDGHWLDQSYLLRASFGTTKYCNNFIRGVPCSNPECVYLHDLGDDDDRFTKEEIQAGHSKINQVPGQNQSLVTGNGGPSGTGKRPAGEPILPPPVFIQDNAPPSASSSSGPTTAAVPPIPKPAPVSRSGTATWNTIAASGVATNDERSRTGSNAALPLASIVAGNGTAGTDSSNTPRENGLPKVSSTENLAGSAAPSAAAVLKRAISGTAGSAALTPRAESNNSSNGAAKPGSADVKTGTAPDLEHKKSAQEESVRQYSSTIPSEAAATVTATVLSEPTLNSTGNHPNIAFSGIGCSAVFPVPHSSFVVSVWKGVAQCVIQKDGDLSVNPYGQIQVPFSDLLDLTLPPVDALHSVQAPSWPRPIHYYSIGIKDGCTYSPAARHIHVSTAELMLKFQSLPDPILDTKVNLLQKQKIDALLNSIAVPPVESLGGAGAGADINANASVGSSALGQQSGSRVPVNALNDNSREDSLKALKMYFPSVNMTVGASNKK